MGSRIAIIGNAGGGKTTLARKLGRIFDLPVTHVDSVQFLSGWRRREQSECDRILSEVAAQKRWVIDGFGSNAIVENRIQLADTVLLVDFPLWRHCWWALKRQWSARHGQRVELPEDCPEFSLGHTRRLLGVMWQVHKQYMPWLRSLLRARPVTTDVIVIRSPAELRALQKKLDSQVGSYAR